MNQAEFSKELSAENDLPPQDQKGVLETAARMTNDERTRFFADLKAAIKGGKEDLQQQKDALDQMQTLMTSGEHTIQTADNNLAHIQEEQEREENLARIAKRIELS